VLIIATGIGGCDERRSDERRSVVHFGARSPTYRSNFYTRWHKFSLALIFHPYWTVSDPAAARTDASFFFGHLSMMGGMLFVVAFGAGAFSVDTLMTQPSTGEIAARRLRLR
jgi:hypothetical protein